jgi:hypothetical protein
MAGDVKCEVIAMVTMKKAVSWDIMLCGSCKNRHIGGTYCPDHQGEKNQ